MTSKLPWQASYYVPRGMPTPETLAKRHAEESLIIRDGNAPVGNPGCNIVATFRTKEDRDFCMLILSAHERQAERIGELESQIQEIRVTAHNGYEAVRGYIHKELGKPVGPLPSAIEIALDTNKAALIEMIDGTFEKVEMPDYVKITDLGGNCPVQGDGTICGENFYFRARGRRWSMGIGEEPVGKPHWYREEPWGQEDFEAGWMPEIEARRIIKRCAEEYHAEKNR